MNTLRFLKEFFKKSEISPRWASPPNWASSLPYEQSLRFLILKEACIILFNVWESFHSRYQEIIQIALLKWPKRIDLWNFCVYGWLFMSVSSVSFLFTVFYSTLIINLLGISTLNHDTKLTLYHSHCHHWHHTASSLLTPLTLSDMFFFSGGEEGAFCRLPTHHLNFHSRAASWLIMS